MDEFTFNAIGTTWCISTDATPLQDDAKKAVLEYIAGFDKRFSRFLADSEANAFRNAKAGRYTISKELAILLSEAQRLRYLTDGVYDPAVGGLLERAGYDATYSMRPLDNVDEFVLPKWTVAGETLTLDGLAVFDIFRRQWGAWNHVVHPQLKKSIERIIGTVAVALNAWHADCTTSALFLS